MEIDKLYDIAEKENIKVINFKMKNKAIIGQLYNSLLYWNELFNYSRFH